MVLRSARIYFFNARGTLLDFLHECKREVLYAGSVRLSVCLSVDQHGEVAQWPRRNIRLLAKARSRQMPSLTTVKGAPLF